MLQTFQKKMEKGQKIEQFAPIFSIKSIKTYF